MKKNEFVVVRIDFPALTELVAYLKSRDKAEVDALAATVEELTGKLHQSTTVLKGTVESVPEP